MAEEKTPKPDGGAKPAAAKKPKAPAIEDKPFPEFIEGHYLPALKEALAAQGISDLALDFKQEKLPLPGAAEPCWQVKGSWPDGQRQFNLYFLDGNLNGQKAFSCGTHGTQPSTLESFMIDERKVTLDLLLLYTLQRLNGQKWLGRN